MHNEKFDVNEEEARRDDITIEEEAMIQESMLKTELFHLLPPFKLESTEGKMVSPWDYKERKNLLLFFFRAEVSEDWEILSLLKQRFQDFSEISTEILAIGRGTHEEIDECVGSLDLPFQVLIDTTCEVTGYYCMAGSAIFAADRFNSIRFMSEVTSADADKVIDQALAVIELAELECPECGVATWPEL